MIIYQPIKTILCLRRHLMITILLCLISNISAAASQHNINHAIKQVTHTIGRDNNQRQKLLSDLKNTELKSSQLQLQISRLTSQLKTQSLSVEQLRQKQHQFQQQLEQRLSSLRHNLSALYILEKQPAIKLLLDHKTDNKTSRMLVYYQFLNQAKIRNVQQIKSILKKIQANKISLTNNIKSLGIIKGKNQLRRQQLNNKHQQRQQLLHKINLRIKGRQALLNNLNQRREKLDSTVKGLSHTRTQQKQHSLFTILKGKLAWPTKGRITNQFGQSVLHSQLRQAGIIISATAGQPVKAIATGKVIFAKWLLGYGQLLIISHENGYMTLYGRNQNIFKKVGDSVKPGEIIATVGDTGGNPKTGLYFAIRHNAKALNPLNWCKKRNA